MNKLKKYVLVVVAMLVMMPYFGQAQTDERNRVASTIIADALNQLPANDKATEDKLMQEILGTGEDGIESLALMLKPSSVGGNAQIEYALDGLCDFVTVKGNENFRNMLANAVFRAIEKSESKDVKAYLIALFQLFGIDDDAVMLMEYANDKDLYPIAIVTIGAIPNTEKMLYDIAENCAVYQRCVVASAIATQRVTRCEDMLISWIEGADDFTKENIYYALSVIGSEKSLEILSKEAKNVKYGYSPTGVTASYIRLLDRYAEEKNVEVIANATKPLLKSKNANIRITALGLIVKAEGETASQYLINALKDKELQVRMAALTELKPYANETVCNAVVGKLDNKNTELEALAWLGEVRDTTQLEYVIKKLSSKNKDVVGGAIMTIVNIGDKKAMKTLLPFFGSEYQPVVRYALKNADDPNIELIMDALKGTTEQVVGALDVIEARPHGCYSGKVISLTRSQDVNVKAAAYKALPGVATISNITYLRNTLASVEEAYLEYVQLAAIKVLARVDANGVIDFVSSTDNIPQQTITRYYKVFAFLAEKMSVQKLLEGYRNDATHDKAVEALLSIENVNVTDTLYNLAIKDVNNNWNLLNRYVVLIDKSDRNAVDKLTAYRKVLGLNPNDKMKNQILKYIEATQTYQGMMLAAYYLEDEATEQRAANTILNIASRHPEYNGREIVDLLVRIREMFTDGDAIYKKTQIDEHLRKIEAAPKFELSPEEAAEGFVVLFDGTNLDRWVGDKTDYIVQNGNIYVTANYGDEGNLYTDKEYSNFIYRFEFCFTRPGVNNGVGIRTVEHADAAYEGMEIQILDHDAPIYAGLREYQVHGSVYGVIPAKRIVFPELGTWNTEEIYANGDHIRVTVNGEVIVDGNIRKACNGRNVAPEGKKGARSETVDHNDHPGLFNKSGKISFCGHGEGLLIRNVRIKEL